MGSIAALFCVFTTPLTAFEFNDTIGNNDLLHENESGPAIVRTMRNSCSLDTGRELETYLAGLNEWNSLPFAQQLFEHRFFNSDCSIDHNDGFNEVGLVRTGAIDGKLGLTKWRCRVRDGRWKIIESDTMVATDACPVTQFFEPGTFQPQGIGNIFNRPELTPPSPGCDVFGTYLHELGHNIGIGHQNGREANIMSSGSTIPRTADNRDANQPFITKTWASILPDERAAARHGYSSGSARGFGTHLFTSAQYFPANLGIDFVNAAISLAVSPSTISASLGTSSNWTSPIGNSGRVFSEVFAEAFFDERVSTETDRRPALAGDRFTVNLCAGDHVLLPFSIGNGARFNINDICHTFFLADNNDNVAGSSLARSSECGLRLRPHQQNPANGPGGFVSSVAQVKVSEFISPGTYWLHHRVNTCQSTQTCEFVSSDDRPFDDSVRTDIRIRVQTDTENPQCPADPLNDPISTFCQVPLTPRVCSTNNDCEGLIEQVEAERNINIGMDDVLDEDFHCLPGADEGTPVSDPSITMTCQCPELPPEFVVP